MWRESVEKSIVDSQLPGDFGDFSVTVNDPTLPEPVIIPVGPQSGTTTKRSVLKGRGELEATHMLSKRENFCYPLGNHWMYLDGINGHIDAFCNAFLNNPICGFCSVTQDKIVNGQKCHFQVANLAGFQRTIGAGTCGNEFRFIAGACRYTDRNPDNNNQAWTRGGWTRTLDNIQETTLDPFV